MAQCDILWSYRILWVKAKFSKVTVWGVVVGTVPMKEIAKKGKDSATTWTGFWTE